MGNLFSDIKNSFPVMLAPMEDITDSAFRIICREYGADAAVTEFIAADGLVRDAVKSIEKLRFSEKERPIGIQLFGNNPHVLAEAAMMAQEVKPDFIDLNFGCPVKKVVNKGGGAALMKEPEKMACITKAVVQAVNIPVTAKTRLGWDDRSVNIMEISEMLQDQGIQMLTIHGRTRMQMYRGTADWSMIGKVKNNQRMVIPVIGNGDIASADDVYRVKTTYGVDGVMIGRAAIGNPWIFGECKGFEKESMPVHQPTLSQRTTVCRRHLILAAEAKGEVKAIREIRKHYSGYFKHIPHFKNYRMKLVTAASLDDLFKIFDEIQNIQ